MAARGSGIGASLTGGLGVMGSGGSATSLRGLNTPTGSLYGRGRAGVGGMQVHHWLWVLVAIELGFLFFLRLGPFARYHGG